MSPADPNPDEEKPGVPFFNSWRGVYWFVLVVFIATVALLAVFTDAFSG